ncbi:MAG: beta-galactosidase [Kiritimatiellales bacterium]
MKNELFIFMLGMLCCTGRAGWAVTDDFNRADTASASNVTEVAALIGPGWVPVKNPADVDYMTQYRIYNNELAVGKMTPNPAKATLIHSGAFTSNGGAGTDFALSATMKDSAKGGAILGLVCNYQNSGNYYVFRLTAAGIAQMLCYSNFVQQTAAPLFKVNAFSYVKGRAYTFKVTSAAPYVYNFSITDTASNLVVYSAGNITVGDRNIKLKDGLGGVYVGSSTGTVDDFRLATIAQTDQKSPASADGTSPENQALTVKFDARGAGLKPEYKTLKSWGGSSPDGHVLRANNYFLELDGKPLPLVMGEIHPQRYPAEYWEEAILEMKAAGLNGISVYVFWSQLEPRPGEFDFSGNKNIRRFVELCAKHGMYVWPRVGPFCNAEMLLGGLPSWLYGMPLTERSNQPRYLQLVGRYYGKLGEQLKGLMWEQGGPIVGFQLENELGVAGVSWDKVFPQHVNKSGFTGLKGAAYTEHYRNLKKLAVSSGLNAPFFSCTGWGLGDSKPVPCDEIMPTELGYMGGYYYHKLTDRNWVTAFDNTGNVLKPYWGKCPVGLSEIGTGLPVETAALGREPLPPEIYSCAALTRVGAMPTVFAGYYMFHGGSNPRDTSFGWSVKQDKYPQISYDFQAPIGEFGDWRPSLFHLRPFNNFLVSYGADLAGTEVRQPADPVTKGDDNRLRAVARMNGESGFIFFNNYGCVTDFSARPDAHFKVQTSRGTITVPRLAGLNIPPNAMGILPVGLDLGGGARLLSATVQPVFRFKQDGQMYHIFSQLSGMPCELVLDKEVKVESTGSGASEADTAQADGARVFNVNPGRGKALTLHAPDGAAINLLVLSQEDARDLAVFSRPEGTLLALSSQAVTFDGRQLQAASLDSPNMEVSIFPPLKKAVASQADGLFQRLELSAPARSFEPQIEKFAPNKWVLKVPEKAFDGLNDIYLDIGYAGQACRIFDIRTGQMVADNFKLAAPWRVGLKRFRTQLAGEGLWIRAEPDRADVVLPDNPEVVTGVAAKAPPANASQKDARLENFTFVPEYRVAVPVQ